MNKIRVSAVKYANTYPFIYGLKESGFEKRIILETDHPADCAAKLIGYKVDIGLIPVAALPQITEYHIISNYCIGSNGNVRTVMMLSNCPFEKINSVYLDYRSRTSVNLSKVLARNYWERNFRWINTSKGFDFLNTGADEAVVLIGDQCFEYENRFKYRLDLSSEWKKFSGLPFVFACWAANRIIDPGFIDGFNQALSSGVNNIDAVVENTGDTGSITGEVLRRYLTENIDFNFNDEKKEGMALFLKLMDELQI